MDIDKIVFLGEGVMFTFLTFALVVVFHLVMILMKE